MSHCAGQMLTARATWGMMLLTVMIALLIMSVTHSAESAASALLPVLLEPVLLELVLEPELLAMAGGVICRMSSPATSARVASCCAFMMVVLSVGRLGLTSSLLTLSVLA